MIKSNFRKYESYNHFESEWRYSNTPEEAGVSSVSYGDIKQNDVGDFIEVPYCTFSDYSGDTVNRANCEYFLETWGKLDGVYRIYGGHNTTGVLIRRSLYESNEEIKEAIDGLEDYPLFNDERLSELEIKLESEAWESWIKTEVQRELADIESPSPLILRLLDDDNLLESSFWYIIRSFDVEFIHEDAVSAYIRTEEIMPHYNGLNYCKKHKAFYYDTCGKCQPSLF
jgi:hypothetical protein